MALRIIFMGTPDFSVPTLEALVKAGHEIVAVYSQPPRPRGRGQKLTPSPVHAWVATPSGAPETTSRIGRAKVVAKAWSRSSCAGTAMIAPVP